MDVGLIVGLGVNVATTVNVPVGVFVGELVAVGVHVAVAVAEGVGVFVGGDWVGVGEVEQDFSTVNSSMRTPYELKNW